MTLHEAIQQALLKAKKSLTAPEIAEVLNANSWYSKKDGSDIKSSQVAARVKSHSHLFSNANNLIALRSSEGIVAKKSTPKQKQVSVKKINLDPKLMMKVLINEKNFKSITECEQNVPEGPGLYAVRIKDIKALDIVFLNVLAERNHTIMYIGHASKNLRTQFYEQELRAKGHGTFFRTIGAILGYVPEKGSLIGKSNQNNYKFAPEHEQEIIQWIEEHLIFNWIATDTDLQEMEAKLIKEHLPLLNLAGNPGVINNIRMLRNKCKEIARGNK
ncbi:GIY-YIG nuclease family protein [Gelidibacter pelagius]|uniref:GIY-YIG catalytic domain-containing protein n=1 Tax=Gelidibacter pelagius TaxID=2819985 RepID=A0ABS3SRM4_9FLAO|nr:hypothetical protein [Gelidibacter pelagius]MBO3098299.1 hypothetical protein [Gelidibacter pelagius]